MLRRQTAGVVALAWVEEKSGVVRDHFEFGKPELGNHEIGIGIVGGLTCETAPNSVFVIVIVPMVSTFPGLR